MAFLNAVREEEKEALVIYLVGGKMGEKLNQVFFLWC